MDTLSYFASQSPITEPGGHKDLFQDVPKDIPGICGVVQGLCLDHEERYKHPIVNERLLETHSRYVSAILDVILAKNKAPLTQPRKPVECFLASCSDYVSLFCAMARYHGIPARKRVGFRTDGSEGGVSHEVAEYWDEAAKCWKQADPSGFVTDKFIPAAQAWQDCRNGQADPETFRDKESKGLGVVRAALLLDLAAWNKMELLNWDRYGWMNRPFEDFSDKAWELLDRLAELLLAGDEKFDELQELYAREEGLQVPRVITCDTPLVPPHKVELTF